MGESPDMGVSETEGFCVGSEGVTCCVLTKLESAANTQVVGSEHYRLGYNRESDQIDDKNLCTLCAFNGGNTADNCRG